MDTPQFSRPSVMDRKPIHAADRGPRGTRFSVERAGVQRVTATM
jgi:hypothetical protein